MYSSALFAEMTWDNVSIVSLLNLAAIDDDHRNTTWTLWAVWDITHRSVKVLQNDGIRIRTRDFLLQNGTSVLKA